MPKLFDGKTIKYVGPKDFKMTNSKVIVKNYGDTLLVVTTSWCQHCVRLKPELEKFAKIYGKTFPILNIDADTEENKKLLKTLKVEGFPTIFLVSNSIVSEKYEGDREASSLSKGICTFTKKRICFM